MKGQSELTATFVKLVQIGLVIIGALAIFFTYIEYEIIVYQNNAQRESYVLGNAILSSDCFTDGTKGLLIQNKLDMLNKDCFRYPGKFSVTSDHYNAEIQLMPKATYIGNATFDALIKLNTSVIEPAKVEVYV
jgi:hypothetical protein